MSSLKVFIAGHKGMVGSALIRLLQKKKKIKIITKEKTNLDLTNQLKVKNFFKKNKIDQVYMAAAKVGGIYANNTFPAEFIYQNLMIQTNIINAAFESGVKKLLFLGSSCIYPKDINKPIKEDLLLKGQLEPTNEPYAVAKIAGIKLCESYNRQYGLSHDIEYRSIMPTNLYGPGDNYHPENSHVIPALIRRFHHAKLNNLPEVIVWGSGNPRREFLYVDDLATACVHVMNLKKSIFQKHTKPMCSHINVGVNKDIMIKDLVKIIKQVVGYNGKIKFDTSKPDGNPRKLINSKCINSLGWYAKTDLTKGLAKTYKSFLKI